MNYKKYLFLFFILFSCTTTSVDKEIKKEVIFGKAFSNKGFTLLYNPKLKKDKKISKSLDNRSLVIFQKNLKQNTKVKITNLINSKSVLATVGPKTNYPSFYNSVISERIFNLLKINEKEPYVEITEVLESSTFLAKKAKTYDEEKEVAEKVPVESVSINDLSNNKKDSKKPNDIIKFNYIIKVADFYYKNTAIMMKKRIIVETKIENVKINKLSTNTYRVFLGPFKDLNSIKKAFIDMNILDFENLEIIKQ